jgi:pyruvate formate lyase activating enzyme
VDFPGEVAATLFTAGCNLKCPYCHNPQLIPFDAPAEFISVADALGFLRRRRGVLSGVCVSGGEPLLQPWLPDAIRDITDLGFKVKLDTNGLLPDRLPGLALDYLAIDLKLAPRRYTVLGGTNDPGANLVKTICWARKNVPRVEFRTTVVPGLVTEDDFESITALLEPGDLLTLAAFRNGVTLSQEYETREEPSQETMMAFRAIAVSKGIDCRVRDHRATTETGPAGR